MKIIKHSGDIVEFDKSKLERSLLKSGANKLIVDAVLVTIEKEVFEGITTKSIYKLAFNLLKKASNSHAARYNLRTSIELLGPAGFFFEKYVARIFNTEGYKTKNNLTLQGKCISHEIDVVIQKGNEIAMVECKFHERRESNSDVKVPMYILSRFNDLKDKIHPIFTNNNKITKCWIITNNRFTTDAITFAKCSGLNLLSWDYPENNNFRHKIDNNQLYPVTCLTTLTIAEKEKLLILNIILVKELINNSESLEKIGLNSNRIKNVLKEVSELCKYI
ncbi:restriction endonuclease [Flavobacterium sp.]|uniref:restriction endonuclease n=1 Tax=Flavobacterium sp. TaxID=239 RepID=UPI00374CA633